MSRKQKKKDAREQSTRQLMGIDDITDYGIATRMGELVFFAIKPTNISVLPDTGVGARIYALLNVVKGMAEIEMLALNSKESFENNKAFYRQRANEEGLPVIRKLLEQDSKHLDRIQVFMASSREFYILVRLQGKKESDVFSYLSRIEKSIKDNGFTVRRAAGVFHGSQQSGFRKWWQRLCTVFQYFYFQYRQCLSLMELWQGGAFFRHVRSVINVPPSRILHT